MNEQPSHLGWNARNDSLKLQYSTRNKEIARRLIAGETAEKIANDHGICRERVFQVARKNGYKGRKTK